MNHEHLHAMKKRMLDLAPKGLVAGIVDRVVDTFSVGNHCEREIIFSPQVNLFTYSYQSIVHNTWITMDREPTYGVFCKKTGSKRDTILLRGRFDDGTPVSLVAKSNEKLNIITDEMIIEMWESALEEGKERNKEAENNG